MKLSEMQAIAEKRTKNKITLICENSDAEFIIMCTSNWNCIMAVLQAAKEASTYQEYHEEFPGELYDKLRFSLAELERE